MSRRLNDGMNPAGVRAVLHEILQLSKFHGKSATLAEGACNADFPARFLADLLGDGKPQAKAAVFAAVRPCLMPIALNASRMSFFNTIFRSILASMSENSVG